MADAKTTALTAATSWASGDLLYMVSNPGGTPASRKITLDNVLSKIVCAANAKAIGVTGYSLTGSDATSMIDLAGTWSTTGNPVALKMAITNTASGSTSKFLECLAGASGTTGVVDIVKDGYVRTTGRFESGALGNPNGVFGTSCVLGVNGVVSWSSGTAYSSADTILLRDAANTLALRNGANAQAFNIYNTYTSGSVYERGFMRWVSNVLEIGTEHVGASARSLALKTDNTTRLTISTTGNFAFSGSPVFTSAAQLIFDPTCYFGSGSAATSRQGIANGFINGSAFQFLFSSTTAANGTVDTGLARTIAGVVGITNGSTGGGAIGLVEMTSPAAPATNGVYIFAEDDGAGKTRLMARFATGATQQLAIEP